MANGTMILVLTICLRMYLSEIMGSGLRPQGIIRNFKDRIFNRVILIASNGPTKSGIKVGLMMMMV